jgi:hypothetical protein
MPLIQRIRAMVCWAVAMVCWAVLPVLFAVLVVLELAPIVAVIVSDALWFMWVPEEFAATLWPPLRPLLPGSYFYHYFGFAYCTVLRPLH